MVAEIERKFLVLDDSWRIGSRQKVNLRQGYVVVMKNRVVRVRTIDNTRAVLTVKIRTSEIQREEFEFPVPYDQAEEMLAFVPGIVEKVRHEVEFCGRLWQLDVYSGAHSGLVTAEIELDSIEDAPTHPPWLGPEITGDPRYSNRRLALKARPDRRLRKVG